MVYIVINLQEINFTVKCPLDYTGGCCVFFVPLWITFDATSFPSSQTGGFSSFHPQSRLSLVGVNQNYFSIAKQYGTMKDEASQTGGYQ